MSTRLEPMAALLDRQRERAALDGLLGDLRSGRGRALMVRGEAGVGKAAQSFPSRPVPDLVSAAAGGVTDVVARAIGQKLSEMWGQPVIIENKGGAAHMLDAQAVAKAAPDGHTLLVAEAGTFVLNPSLYSKEKLGYDVDKELVPVTGLVRIYQALIASNDLP